MLPDKYHCAASTKKSIILHDRRSLWIIIIIMSFSTLHVTCQLNTMQTMNRGLVLLQQDPLLKTAECGYRRRARPRILILYSSVTIVFGPSEKFHILFIFNNSSSILASCHSTSLGSPALGQLPRLLTAIFSQLIQSTTIFKNIASRGNIFL